MLPPDQNGSASDRVADLQRQVRELQALRLLVGGLAHDVNNLLTAVVGHASLISLEVDPESEAAESATAILNASEHATAIVRQLQSLIRGGRARREPVDLHQTIADVISLLKPSTYGQIEITCDLDASASVTLADPEQMHQLLLNLALNARDAMPVGGRLTFATALEEHPDKGEYVVLSVTDTGCGIPEEDRERIFEPFFTTRESSGGTGLGLAVAARIVRKHQGMIQVESAEGAGSTFRIHLPVAARSAEISA